MQALVWLLAALGAAALGGRWPARAAALLLAATAGLTLPDLDQSLPLAHRSALTHSVLPVLALLGWSRGRPVAAGLGLGLGFHLAADVFPNAMRGFATVKWPLAGSMGADASYWWLALNSATATLAGVALTAREFAGRIAAGLLAATLALGVAYLFVTDGGWPVLALYGTGGWLIWRRR